MSNEASRDPIPPAPSLSHGHSRSSSSSSSGFAAGAAVAGTTSVSARTSPPGTGVGRQGQEVHGRRRRRRGAPTVAAMARIAAMNQTKIKFLTEFIRAMDIVVYFYFSLMYFLDNSFFRFFIRCAIQLNFLTPKPVNIPTPPQRRAVIIGLVGWTIINILFHLINDNPSAGEASGGYLHGGLIIDFIGQEGPISKYRLVITDLIILLLQLVMLAATLTKQGLLGIQTATRRGTVEGSNTEVAESQDLDSEERGERRRRRSIGGVGAGDGQEDDHAGERRSTSASNDVGEDALEEGDDTDNDERAIDSRDSAYDGPYRRRRRRIRGLSQRRSSSSRDRPRPEERRSLLRGRDEEEGINHEPGGEDDDDGGGDTTAIQHPTYDIDGRYAQYSGQLVVAELSIVDAVRRQWRYGLPGVGNQNAMHSTSTVAPGVVVIPIPSVGGVAPLGGGGFSRPTTATTTSTAG